MVTSRLEVSDFRILTTSQPSNRLLDGANVAVVSCASGCALDGVVAKSSAETVDLAAIEPWMTGLRWILRAADDHTWTLHNQGDSHNCLVGLVVDDEGTVALGRFEREWISLSSRWKIYTSNRTKYVMLCNFDGGWLTMGETGAFLSKRKTTNIGPELLWDLADAESVLRPFAPSNTLQSPAPPKPNFLRWLRRRS